MPVDAGEVDEMEISTRGSQLEEITRAMVGGGLVSPTKNVEVRETHASRVFLTLSDVYKLKKPVDLGFLNYSTLARRRTMCRLEVSLNQRLAPDVYLGVDRLTRERDGELALNGRGPVVEYLVHMRRLADEVSLDSLLRSGEAGPTQVRNVGAILGAFHSSAAPVSISLGPQTFRRNARDNLASLQSSWPATLPGFALGEISSRFLEALEGSRREIARRAKAGLVRDGHGDLRMEHVYLEERVQVIDCVEFSKQYRASDTALDFAFLVMDMESSGYAHLVGPLIDGYQSSANDDVGAVRGIYSVYRALVRAKVALILAGEEDAPGAARRAAGMNARMHLHYTLRTLRGLQPPLLLAIGGLPGTGKSTLARALAAATGSVVRSADETRKRLAGMAANTHPESAIDSGIYSEAMNKRVYSRLLEEASAALRSGRSCILDATFRRARDVDQVRQLAVRTGAAFLMVRCEAPEETVLERLRQRATTPDTWSDATEATYFAHRSEVNEVLDEAALIVDTTRPITEQVDVVLTQLWS
ncbi:MAG: AAA family ATPase [Dehalococcoidia bacterium]